MLLRAWHNSGDGVPYQCLLASSDPLLLGPLPTVVFNWAVILGGAKRMGGGKRTRERALPKTMDPSKRASCLLRRGTPEGGGKRTVRGAVQNPFLGGVSFVRFPPPPPLFSTPPWRPLIQALGQTDARGATGQGGREHTRSLDAIIEVPSNLTVGLSGPLRLRVQSRSRRRLPIATSITCFFRVWFVGASDIVAPLFRTWAS